MDASDKGMPGVKWQFETDQESSSYCDDIANEMASLFGIAKSEAVGRINRRWKGFDFRGNDHRVDMLYHEEPDYWANDTYYGPESDWWIVEVGLEPLPFH